MAFWGIEVKPGNRFTHKHDDSKGRLHISMATLAYGSATAKSVLQCNVGKRSPVYLCVLYPVSAESLQLNLEFEEADDVVFSVIGPRSIFLAGYYLRNGGYELEPHGEDIADTETERSEDSDEDEYEDSFINDDDPEVYPPSTASDGEIMDNEKPKNRKDSRKRLRKRYQLLESDDEGCSQQKDIVNGSSGELVLQSEDEDCAPISSLYQSKTTTKKTIKEVEGNADKGTVETSNKKTEDDKNYVIESTRKAENVFAGQPKSTIEKTTEDIEGKIDVGTGETSFKSTELKLPDSVMLPSTEVGCEDGERQKRKRKEREKEGKIYEAEINHNNFVKEDKAQQNESNAEKRVQDFLLRDKAANDREAELLDNFLLPSTKVEPEDGEKPKKKRKEQLKERKAPEAESKDNNIVIEDKMQQDEVKADNMVLGSLFDSNVHEFAGESHSKKKIKKKKKSKTQENVEAVYMNMPLLSADKIEDKKVNDKSSQVRTLSNGLKIEVLEMGKPDGKIAASGKRISVNYSGKLKKNEEPFDSNVGDTLFKFRLGVRKVIEGWDIGLDGMQVGEKRRLIIPPTMAFGSEGWGEKVPPDSWLEYDVELVKVH